MTDYTEEYRLENDPLADWIAESCVLGSECSTASTDLRRSYERRCMRNSITPIDVNSEWGRALSGHGCRSGRGAKGRRMWRGIALKG